MFATITSFVGDALDAATTAVPPPPDDDGTQSDDTNTDSDNDETEKEEPPDYQPSVMDVLVVKALLQQGLSLPIEIVDVVCDYAEYWPHTSTLANPNGDNPSPLTIYGGPRQNENRFLLRTQPVGFIKHPHPRKAEFEKTPADPIPLVKEHSLQTYQKLIGSPEDAVEHPVRKIVFNIESHDQGWGGNTADNGTYHGSWTWFDVGLERFEAESTCKENCPDQKKIITPSGSDSTPLPLPICSLRPIIPALEPETPSTEDTEPAAEPLRQPLKLKHDLLQSDMLLQSNVCARSKFQEHCVVWRWTDCIDPESPEGDELEENGRGRRTGNGEFVRGLKLGDVVTLWAKSRFPGWVNHVKRVRVDVYWAV